MIIRLLFILIFICLIRIHAEEKKKNRPMYNEKTLKSIKKNKVYDCEYAKCSNSGQGSKTPNSKDGIILTGCNGITYFATNKMVKGYESWDTCCELGMVPATFSSADEFKCLANLVKKKKGFGDHYFTAYVDAQLNNKFISCITKEPVLSQLWCTDDPNNKKKDEACVTTFFYHKSEGAPYQLRGLSDMSCADGGKLRGVLCQSTKSFEEEKTETRSDTNKAIFKTESSLSSSRVVYNFGSSMNQAPSDIFSLLNRQIQADLYNLESKPMMDFPNLEPQLNLGPKSMMDFPNQEPKLNLGPKPMMDFSILEPQLNLGPKSMMDFSIFGPKQNLDPYKIEARQSFLVKNLYSCGFKGCKESTNGSISKLPANVENGITLAGCSNKTYFIPNSKGMASETWQRCCSFGMIPASLTSITEIRCLTNQYNTNKNNGSSSDEMFFTSYIDQTMSGSKFSSCATNEKPPSDIWAILQPDNKYKDEMCTALRLDGPLLDIGLHDVSCEPKSERRIICEETRTIKETTENTTVPAIIINSTMLSTEVTTTSMYMPMSRNYSILSGIFNCQNSHCNIQQGSNNTFTNVGKDLKNEGFQITTCGKSYLLSTNKSIYADSWDLCCQLGLTPASIENKTVLQCLHSQFITKFGQNVVSTYFTAQMDAKMDRNFKSCSTNNVVTSDLFIAGEPDNALNREACVAVKFTNQTAGLIDIRCGEYTNVICEIPNNLLKPTNTTPYINQANKVTTTIKSVIGTTVKTTNNPTVKIQKNIASSMSTFKFMPFTTSRPNVLLTVKPSLTILAATKKPAKKN